MGGGGGTGIDIIDDNIEGATEFISDTIRTGVGVASGGLSETSGAGDVIEGGTGELTGSNAKKRAEAEKAAAAQEQQQMQTMEADRAQAEKDATAEKEQNLNERRMAGGSRSRTLLTGSDGVEEDEENLTRRTLGAL